MGLPLPERKITRRPFGFVSRLPSRDAGAQNNLGVMYQQGWGVLEDYVQAYAWWSIAATQGDEDAKTNKGIIKNKMTPEQIAKGQERAVEYWEKYVVPFQKDLPAQPRKGGMN